MAKKYSKIDFAIDINNYDPVHSSSTKPTILNNLLTRLILKGKIYELNTDTIYAKYISRALTLGLKSEWYQSLSSLSQIQISNSLIGFIKWFKEIKVDENNKCTFLKDFETYQVNVRGLKPQSTGLSNLLSVIKNGIDENDYDNDLNTYIELVLIRTNISKYEPPIPETLTTFFGSIHWLRNEIGNENFLKLESPKRLINSFSVTVASILCFILKIKKEAKKELLNNRFESDSDTLNVRAQRQFYCGNLFSKLSKFDENYLPANQLTELMILDFVPQKKIEKLITLWKRRQIDPNTYYSYQLNGRQVFSLPNIFGQDAWDYPSEIEQVLFSWLCSWQTVQPSDVAKLKRNDFILSKNNEGRVIYVQCSYYKGRSNRVNEPPMLDARQVEGSAIIEYLEYFLGNTTHLISSINIPSIQITFGANSITERLVNLMNYPPLDEEIKSNLWKRKANPIFINSILALHKNKEHVFTKWVNKLKKEKKQKLGFTVEEYVKSTPFPIPSNLFRLNAIKNSAVHATSDKYRDGDLINQNSHSNITEKISYLTDANKDWVNQNGRITRMVLHDIERHVYKPNIDRARNDAYELCLRTQVINALDGGVFNPDEIRINQIGQLKFSKETYQEFNVDPDGIIVLDTEETIVTMLHYINEVDSKKHILINKAVTFFERTVLPNVEWMEYLLNSKLSPEVIKNGTSQYDKLKNILPTLFENEIRGGLGE